MSESRWHQDALVMMQNVASKLSELTVCPAVHTLTPTFVQIKTNYVKNKIKCVCVYLSRAAVRPASLLLLLRADEAADVNPDPLQKEQEGQQVEEHSDHLWRRGGCTHVASSETVGRFVWCSNPQPLDGNVTTSLQPTET